ncbi:MAG: hypothetical protein JW709_04625 [Sedimentisphaerales bacterium]|nr:hypothetical protein [Sedimentisphaerales bacterium]
MLKKTTHILLVLMAVCLSTVGSLHGQYGGAPGMMGMPWGDGVYGIPPEGWEAGPRVMLKIHCDERILPLNSTFLGGLLDSWELPDKNISVNVAPQARGGDYQIYFIQIELFDKKEDIYIVDPEKAKGALNWLIERLTETLQKEYSAADEQRTQRLEIARKQQAEAEAAFSLLREKGRLLREQAGMTDLNRQRVVDLFSQLEQRRNSLEMELAGLVAQRGEMQNQITIMHEKLETNLADDPISQQLREIIAMQRQALELAQTAYKSGNASQDKLLASQQALKEAEIRLAQHQETIKASSGSNDLQITIMKLGEIAVQVAQKEEELKFINLKLEEMRQKDLLRLAENYSIEVEMKVDQANREYQEAADLVARLQREGDMLIPPRVVVLGD